MRIDLALLADYALVDKMDKLTVAGIFRRISGTQFPFSHGPIYLALIMTIEPHEDSSHEVILRLIDPDGQDIIPELKAEIDIQRADSEADSVLNLVLQVNGVPFKASGPHCFDIFVDGRFVERVPFEVGLAKVKGSEPSAEQ